MHASPPATSRDRATDLLSRRTSRGLRGAHVVALRRLLSAVFVRLRGLGPRQGASWVAFLGGTALLVLVSACVDKSAPTPKEPVAAQRSSRMAGILTRLHALPTTGDPGLPIVVPLDASRHALSSSPRSAPRQVIQPGNVAPNGGIWKSVGAPPSSSGGGNSASFYQNGSRSDHYKDSNETVRYNSDGSRDYTGADGSTIHVYDPSRNPEFSYYKNNADGSVDVHSRDGVTDHVSADGKNDYTDWGNGKRSTWGPDGQETIDDQNDGSRKTIDHKDGSSVTLPQLVQKPVSDKPAHGTGEPHYLTRDGTQIMSQAAGEFVLVTGVDGHEMQARQQPWGKPPEVSDKVSAITALAFRVSGSKVEVRLDGTVMIDGEAAGAGDFVQGEIPGGGVVGVWRRDGTLRDVVVVWPDLSVARVTRAWSYLSFVMQWTKREPDHRGILGSNDDDPGNDLTDRTGKVWTNQPEGIAAFLDSWRVTDSESLFTYLPGESTSSFTQLDFPHPSPPPDMKNPPDDVASLPPGPLREMYAYDLALTGDRRFKDAYVEFAGRVSALQSQALDHGPSQTESPATIALTAEDMKSAKEVPADEALAIHQSVPAGGSLTYRLRYSQARKHEITSYTPGPKTTAYVPGQPGYAFYDSNGQIIGKALPAVNDDSIELKADIYFFKVAGSGGIIDLTVK